MLQSFDVLHAGPRGGDLEIITVLVNYATEDPTCVIHRKDHFEETDQEFFGIPASDTKTHVPLVFIIAINERLAKRGRRSKEGQRLHNKKRRDAKARVAADTMSIARGDSQDFAESPGEAAAAVLLLGAVAPLHASQGSTNLRAV